MARQKASEATTKAAQMASDAMGNGSATVFTMDDGTKVVVAPVGGRGGPVTDLTKPQRDGNGDIPEFACVSFKRQQITVPERPTETFIIEPFEVLKGEQWRVFAEPSKAWGSFPPFWQRPKGKDGEPVAGRYLLTEEQALKLVDLIKNPHFGTKTVRSTQPGVLDLMEKRGKVMRYDERTGQPMDNPDDLYEDRAPVLSAVGKRKRELLEEHGRRMRILTGKTR